MIACWLHMQELYVAPRHTKKQPQQPGFEKATFLLEDVQVLLRRQHCSAQGKALNQLLLVLSTLDSLVHRNKTYCGFDGPSNNMQSVIAHCAASHHELVRLLFVMHTSRLSHVFILVCQVEGQSGLLCCTCAVSQNISGKSACSGCLWSPAESMYLCLTTTKL